MMRWERNGKKTAVCREYIFAEEYQEYYAETSSDDTNGLANENERTMDRKKEKKEQEISI